jgi:hypothetical protein
MSLVSGLLNQTITSISSTVDNGYGDKTKTVVESNVSCRWEEKSTEITNTNGEIIIASAEMWVMSDTSVKNGYRIIKDSSEYTVVGVENKYNLDGQVDHIKVFLL